MAKLLHTIHDMERTEGEKKYIEIPKYFRRIVKRRIQHSFPKPFTGSRNFVANQKYGKLVIMRCLFQNASRKNEISICILERNKTIVTTTKKN